MRGRGSFAVDERSYGRGEEAKTKSTTDHSCQPIRQQRLLCRASLQLLDRCRRPGDEVHHPPRQGSLERRRHAHCRGRTHPRRGPIRRLDGAGVRARYPVSEVSVPSKLRRGVLPAASHPRGWKKVRSRAERSEGDCATTGRGERGNENRPCGLRRPRALGGPFRPGQHQKGERRCLTKNGMPSKRRSSRSKSWTRVSSKMRPVVAPIPAPRSTIPRATNHSAVETLPSRRPAGRKVRPGSLGSADAEE